MLGPLTLDPPLVLCRPPSLRVMTIASLRSAAAPQMPAAVVYAIGLMPLISPVQCNRQCDR